MSIAKISKLAFYKYTLKSAFILLFQDNFLKKLQNWSLIGH